MGGRSAFEVMHMAEALRADVAEQVLLGMGMHGLPSPYLGVA